MKKIPKSAIRSWMKKNLDEAVVITDKPLSNIKDWRSTKQKKK